MLPTQGSIQFSEYTNLYDIVVPQDHELRKLNALCENFDFIYEELKDKYCLDNGRMAEDPRMLFKWWRHISSMSGNASCARCGKHASNVDRNINPSRSVTVRKSRKSR